MKPSRTHIFSIFVLVIIANNALCKTIDNADAEEDTDGPEKIEHKAVTYHAYKVLEVVPESKEQVMPNMRISTRLIRCVDVSKLALYDILYR